MGKLFKTLLLTCLASVTVEGADLLVAASANTSYMIKEVSAAFERRTGHRVRVSTGASGSIYSQILNGAPFDLFLSADADYPRRLEQQGFARPGSLTIYAVGHLVLWTRSPSDVDVVRLQLKALTTRKVRKVAIANPSCAPYGQAALEVLRRFGLEQAVRPKLVLGESASQALHFVSTGAAQVGLLPLSLILAPTAPKDGRYWLIPDNAHSRLEQAAVILKGGRAAPAVASQFLGFLKSGEGKQLLRKYGYLLPEDHGGNQP
ncbi:MAG: molybdate ABC transporter substrate-binding protein [Acidobacteriota bacterium]